MSKKMLKRSLALGALMAFVITGNVWADDVSQTITTLPTISATNFEDVKAVDGVDGIEGVGWNAFYPDNTNFDLSDKLVTNGDITYSGGNLGVYAAYRIDNQHNTFLQRLDNPNNNILEIKHNLNVTDGDVYLYASHVGFGTSESASSAKGNSVLIGSQNEKITIKGTNIFIGGALSNEKKNAIHDVSENKVVIDNVDFEATGAIIISGAQSKGGSAKGNTLEVRNTKIENGTTYILGSFVCNGGNDAKDNTVTLTNVILGENSLCAGSYVQDNGDNANNNTVNIEGDSKIAGEIYGSYNETGGSASNSTIILKDNVDVSSAKIYGNNGVEGTSNKLIVDENYTGNGQINTVGNFDEIEIAEAEYGEAALTVNEMKYKDADASGNGGTKITVKKMTMSGDQELAKGTALNVIESNKPTTGDISNESTATIYKGTSQIIDVNFGGADATVSDITKTVRNDQVLVIGESRAAATAFVNQGSEIVETGLDALARDNAKAGDTKTFAAIYGNASEYATGSHVKVNGWSGIVGIGKTNANGLTVGAFFENGEGNYRTYNTVNNDFMRGDGEACYNGGGILVRKDNANGVYTEASLRAGNLQNELRNAVRGSEGLAGYDIDTFYYGAHIGIGKVIPRGDEGDSIDVYGKFIYTHHGSEDFTIDGDAFHFDSVDSERLRLGFRINEVQTQKLSMYYGAAWEYEFGGDADNTVVGYDLSTPSLGGSTVIGEIGMHYKASEKWSFDINGRAYVGQRDGFTGSVQANYAF